MLVTAALITLGVVGYLNIGYWWGRASWRIWHNQEQSFAGFLCFPLSYTFDSVGEASELTPFAAEFKVQENYAKTMAFIWPEKLVINLIAIPCAGVIVGFYAGGTLLAEFVISPLLILVTNPRALLPKRPPKKQPKQLPPAEPNLDQLNPYEEHQRLLEKREEMNVRLKELEAHPDYEKTRAFPKRLGG